MSVGDRGSNVESPSHVVWVFKPGYRFADWAWAAHGSCSCSEPIAFMVSKLRATVTPTG